MTALVDDLFRRHTELATYLQDVGEVSFLADLEATFPKVLLLAAASYFEEQVKGCVRGYVRSRSAGDEMLMAVVETKAIDRQYHTFFAWDTRNANQFWSMFGADFKKYAVALAKEDDSLRGAIEAFIEIGSLRNGLVHQNYAAVSLDLTASEIYAKFGQAAVFVERLPKILEGYVQATAIDDVS